MSAVTVLLSVMASGQSHSYPEKLNIRTDAVIVDQCGREGEEELLFDGHKVKIRCSSMRGLSRSRNLALSLCPTDCAIFCDNDVYYEDGIFERIGDAFDRYPDAGILVFFVERPERHEPVCKRECDLNRIGMMKIFSPEIAVRRSLIGDLSFDPAFGAGAKYSMGEENIFLFEARRRKIRVVYLPIRIAGLLPGESSWFTGFNEKFFRDRGAGYEAMEPKHWGILSLQFLIRKRGLYKDNAGFFQALKWMKEGRREYLRDG